ncbi:MAG TPA: outer membrane beta-barrel protein [Terriglobales bacterium]|nr:outer membrane beta-barrel protein [Terriglobales bacterium]
MKIPPGENEKSSQPKVLELPSPEQRKVKLTGGGSMTALFITAVIAGCCLPLQAQTTGPEQDEIQKLHEMVIQLKARVEQLEKRQVTDPAQPADQAGPISQNAITNDDQAVHEFPAGTTISVALDGYYGYNFNQPTGRVNLLRAYDVSSNSFSLNQANLIIEHAPDLSANRRAGLRVDFQYGQATETLQGSAVNELRPQVYRPIFQAYGTYVFPVGSGLTVDFGKWPSALGVEGNYGKDQINYSRSFYFNFLPFYHMGFRASYNLSDRANLTYWLVNGAQQTEDFNGFKSQAFLLNLKPAKPVSWNLNYYFGEEQRDVVSMLNPGLPAGPTQPGLPVSNVSPTPNGREHIFDSYITWNATAKLTLVGEGDYLLNRVFSESVPSHLGGGAGYARYQLTHRVALAGRGEYLSDRGGLFSGLTQALKETTATTEYKLGEGLLMRSEWRRDFSNRPFFLTGTAGKLTKEQNTATLGLIWWFGQKQGAW